MIPAMRFFTLSCALKLTAPCTITASSLTGICSQMHVDRGGRSGSCSRRIGLRGNNDRGRSDRGHNTHNAYL